jgi:hypothetical protein
MESFAPQFMVSKEQAARENRRMRSVYGGNYKFIALTLNDIRRRNISGVEIIFSTPFTNEQKGGVTDFHHEVRGGAIRFEFNEAMGVWRYDMLDSEHNRQFLASMYDRNFWDIEDEEIKKDIAKRAAEITASIIGKQEGPEDDGSGETVGSASRDMKLPHVDPVKQPVKEPAKPAPAKPSKMNLPDSPTGQIKNDNGIVTVGARVKQV